jgi:uncharacterized protein YbgA (DUF1722 family)
MGTPREPLRLLRDGEAVRMMTVRTGVDYTASMNTWARQRVEELARENLAGYVLKSKSPSCGMERVKVFDANGTAAPAGRGLFADVLLQRFPALPVEEEGRLDDPARRENFIERVFAYRRLQDLFGGQWTPAALVAFHTRHKMALLAHATVGYRRLGQIVAAAASRPRTDVAEDYQRQFMSTLSILATPKKHANVLMHMAGHLKGCLDGRSKQELLECVDEYRRGLVPLVVPVTLMRHHVRQHSIEYLAGQSYLYPHPRELMLRNHA